MGVALGVAWVAVAICGGLVWRRHRKNHGEVTDAFGLGITVGREFRNMRDEDGNG